ncbi:hypothetical protein HPB48_000355 [Haemaphysalis longicornis]|uniref:Sema domain-containing protein n=1 Tax=Haemaphysalis longicornis TaxID=44386 RepID=A0A9J6H3S2_HAELO|nr:hypothetical protein HPB48_000355 [Haemaphysalis longicornis]
MPSTGYDIRPTKATFVAGGAVDVEVFQATEGPVQNVVVLNYSNAQDPIIVGGRNALYVLSSANFSLEAMESTGPENDSVACPPYPLDCDHSREETDNDNRVLLQMASNPIVLACGTTSQGMCAVHQPLRQLRVNKPMDKRLHVNYVASKESTVAFFGTGEYQAICSVLTKADTFALHEHTDSTASFVNVYKDFKTSYLIRYVYGFSYNGFAYFVTVQNKGAALDLFETRLVRVCEGDVSFLTYMEVPIECPKDAGMRFTIATSASFGPPSNWAGSGLGSGSKMLAVAFGSPVDGRRDKNDPNLGSVVCFFDMATVERAFRETVVNCNEGKDGAKLSRLFHGSHADLKCTGYCKYPAHRLLISRPDSPSLSLCLSLSLLLSSSLSLSLCISLFCSTLCLLLERVH